MEEAEVLRLERASGPGSAAFTDSLSAHLLPALQAGHAERQSKQASAVPSANLDLFMDQVCHLQRATGHSRHLWDSSPRMGQPVLHDDG